MATLLGALLQNESGGRNVANTTEGTDSGQAQGYFQITTGTWDEFGGRQYAPNPLQASYEQQAAVASKIPLRRWAPSTVALMQQTGKPIDPNKTLGENLAANGESFAGTPRVSGPVEAAGGGAGSDKGAPQLYILPTATSTVVAAPAATSSPELDAWAMRHDSSLANTLSSSVAGQTSGGRGESSSRAPQDELGAGAVLPTLDYATATPEAVGPAPALLDLSPLAELFKVKDIGGAAAVDPTTQRPVLSRTRTLG